MRSKFSDWKTRNRKVRRPLLASTILLPACPTAPNSKPGKPVPLQVQICSTSLSSRAHSCTINHANSLASRARAWSTITVSIRASQVAPSPGPQHQSFWYRVHESHQCKCEVSLISGNPGSSENPILGQCSLTVMPSLEGLVSLSLSLYSNTVRELDVLKDFLAREATFHAPLGSPHLFGESEMGDHIASAM